jgi:hypothetical protein
MCFSYRQAMSALMDRSATDVSTLPHSTPSAPPALPTLVTLLAMIQTFRKLPIEPPRLLLCDYIGPRFRGSSFGF